MRRVRAKGVEAVFVLAGAQRRVRPVRPRAIHINEQKEETKMYAPTSQSPRFSLISMEVKVGRAVRRRVGVWSRAFNAGGCVCDDEWASGTCDPRAGDVAIAEPHEIRWRWIAVRRHFPEK